MRIPIPKIIAHRGASFDAPENTLAAFKLANQQNADGFEADFHLTADNQVVCIHDPSTLRTTGHDLLIAQSTLADLERLDAGQWKSPRYAHEKIPTVNQIFPLLKPGAIFLIEIKSGPEILPALQTAIAQSQLSPAQLRIMSFHPDVIAQSKRFMPQIKTYLIVEFHRQPTGQWHPHPSDVLSTLKQTRADGLDANHAILDMPPQFPATLEQHNLELSLWTIDDPATARRARSLNLFAITTNRPEYIRQSLGLS